MTEDEQERLTQLANKYPSIVGETLEGRVIEAIEILVETILEDREDARAE